MHKHDVICYHIDSTLKKQRPMPDILIRNVPNKTLAALKTKARKNKRSLQAELLHLLEREAIIPAGLKTKAQRAAEFWVAADRIKAMQPYSHVDSTDLIREDRNR